MQALLLALLDQKLVPHIWPAKVTREKRGATHDRNDVHARGGDMKYSHGNDVECQCGSLAGEDFECEPIELKECPHCGRTKCQRCNMGDDTSCMGCEGED